MRTVSTVFTTASGFITSPNPVAAKVGSYMRSPMGPFANGYQDFAKTEGVRVWYSEATGAHSGSSRVTKVWVPELGLATSDETGSITGTSINFQYGKIRWSPAYGAKITWADGHGPGTTPTSTTTTTTATTSPSTTTSVSTTPPVTTTAPPTTTRHRPAAGWAIR